MSEMKLIMEGWRGYQKKLLLEVIDMGEFLSTIQAIIAVKKGEKLAGNLLKVAAAAVGGVETLKSLLDTNPSELLAQLGNVIGLGQAVLDMVTGAKDARQVVAQAAKLPDAQRSKAGFLAMLDFDDPYLTILDDKLENDLLNYLLDKVQEAQSAGTSINDFDINKVFEEFIKDTFRRDIKGAPAKRAVTVKARGKLGTAGARVKQKFQAGVT
jgi:hypothetical protein